MFSLVEASVTWPALHTRSLLTGSYMSYFYPPRNPNTDAYFKFQVRRLHRFLAPFCCDMFPVIVRAV